MSVIIPAIITASAGIVVFLALLVSALDFLGATYDVSASVTDFILSVISPHTWTSRRLHLEVYFFRAKQTQSLDLSVVHGDYC